MAAPDLKTAEGVRAYRAELFTVARAWRWSGLVLVTLGAIGLVAVAKFDLSWGSPLGLGTLLALLIGWPLIVVGIILRTVYHKRRLTGWEPGEP
jgi:uncharacterized membrane protein YdfJ with MMPL/SSD domain